MPSLPPSLSNALQLAHQKGILRARDLEEIGESRQVLTALCARGLLQRVERGTYVPVGLAPSQNQTLIEVAQRVPGGVICLLTALSFHDIGTQLPAAVWLCIEAGLKAPKIGSPTLEIVRQSGRAWSEGVNSYELPLGSGSFAVKITSPAKTVADCFKFRNRVGLDVALEALRDVLTRKIVTRDALRHFAAINRVTNVMRPYMEAMSVR